MTVDTLSLAKELRAAELSPMQAEAIAAAIGRAVLEGAATKADIQSLRSDVQQVRAEVQQVKAELETKIEQLRTTLMTWFIGTNLTLAAIIIAVVKL